MQNQNIKRVAIIGGGSSGWMSAAFMATALGPSVSITLVESEELGTVGVGEATIPPIKVFNQRLGISEADFVSSTKGSMKLGIEFVNWGSVGHRYFHPFGVYGAEFDAVPIHQWWMKEQAAFGETSPIEDLSMCWAMAREGRFEHPVGDPRMVQSTFDYAYHFDAGLYAAYLRKLSEARGVTRVEGRVVDVTLDGNSGHVESVSLANGKKIEADLFVDCSGFRALLIDGALKSPYEDWSHWLPCNRAWAMPCELSDFTPYTRSTQRQAGWQWRIPLQHRTGNGYVFCDNFISEDEAASVLESNLDGAKLADPRLVKFTTGRRSNSFQKNVVAIGLSAGFLEPLESTSLNFVQSGLMRLMALWPDKTFDPVVVNKYNALTKIEWERTRDFLILHYVANQRDDAEMWRYCRNMAIPESLSERMANWTNYGRTLSPGPELFQNVSWVAVYLGQHVMPRQWDPMVDARSSSVDYRRNLISLRRAMRESASAMPSHRSWIDKHCPG